MSADVLAALEAVEDANDCGHGYTLLRGTMEADLREAEYILTPADSPFQTGAWITIKGAAHLAALRSRALRARGKQAGERA